MHKFEFIFIRYYQLIIIISFYEKFLTNNFNIYLFKQRIILYLIYTLTFAQDLITIGKLCTCEQLTSQFDCLYLKKCQFVNQVCSQKPCDQMNFEACQISDCAWYNGQCSKFTSCQDYKASKDDDCFDLRHDCTFNNLTNTCQLRDPLTKKCSEQDQANCYKGIEGKCIYKDNKCQIWTNCEDAEYEHCLYGMIHCIWNEQQNKCVQKAQYQ